MPFKIVKKSNGRYKVINKITGKVHAKNTTLKKAKSQIKLIEYLDKSSK